MVNSYWGLVSGKWFVLEDGVIISFVPDIGRNRHDLECWRSWWLTVPGKPRNVMCYYPVEWAMSNNLKRLAGISEGQHG